MAKVLFYTTTAAQFAAAEKNANALYFVSEAGSKSGVLYKGDQRFSFPSAKVEVAEGKTLAESVTAPEQGIVYVGSNGEAGIWNGTSMIIFGSNRVDVRLSNATRHIVTEEEAGNGIFAGYEKGAIGILFSFENSADQLFVSLTDLVDTYVGIETNTAKVTVDGYNISADVKISDKAGNILETVVAADGVTAGLYVPAPVYPEIAVEDTATVDMTAVDAKTVKADIKFSAEEGNIAVAKADGIYVPAPVYPTLSATDTKAIDITVDGYDVKAELLVSSEAKNAVAIKEDGLYVEELQWQTLG